MHAFLTTRSNSTAAEVASGATKAVLSSWADAPNNQQCGTYEYFTSVQDAFETTCPADAAKGFAHSASLDPTTTERAQRVEKEEGVACPPWWLPLFIGDHDPVHSVDVDGDKSRRDLTSHQSAEQPTPADHHVPYPSSESFDPVRPLSFTAKGREMIAWCWTSSALLCALLFLLSAYVFNGKVATSLLLHAACTPLRPAPCYTLHLAPRSRTLSTFHPGFRTMAAEPDA